MSVEIRATIVCDTCGASIERVQHTTTGMTAYWSAKRAAEQDHWMFNLRYGTTRHTCAKCADGPPRDAGVRSIGPVNDETTKPSP